MHSSGTRTRCDALRSCLTRRVPFRRVLSRLEAAATSICTRAVGAIPREELLAARRRQAGADVPADRSHRSRGARRRPRSARSSPTSPSATTTSIVEACRARGIIVTNTPDVLTNACADFTWALILGITRRLGEGERAAAPRRLEGLGARSPARHGASRQAARPRRRRPHRPRGGREGAGVRHDGRLHRRRSPIDLPDAEHLPLDRLLATSDVVSLHCPLTPETRHLIDQKALTKMKRIGLSHQHVARSGRRRSGTGVGAASNG